MAEILVEPHGAIETWTLNRPEARNAISRALLDALNGQLARVERERPVRVVLLAGAGEAFCAGADLKERARMTEDEVRAFLNGLRAALRAMEESDRTFIAAVDGPALGGGMELALACDLRVASPRAQFALTETSLGIIPGGGGTQRLARLVGPGRAKDLILTGRRVGGEEAFALGLAERLARGQSALAEARALAESIARNAPLALAAAKHAIDEGLSLPLDQALDCERRHYERTLGTRDRLEGLAAFAEKRPPRFLGE